MIPTFRVALLGMIVAAGVPALAQSTGGMPPREMMLRPGGGPFATMSLEARRMMQDSRHDAMVANRADSDRVAAARDRMLDLLGAERFDAAAFKRAMDDEREASQAMKARQQAATLALVQRLSPADRKAFADGGRALRARVEGRMGMMKRRGPRGGEDLPPPM